MKRLATYCLLALAFAGRGLATEPTAAHPEGWADEAVAAGVALFDRGELQSARAKFEEVLASNPRHEAARYELTITLEQQQEWDACIKEAETGLKSATRLRAAFFSAAGNCSDGAGKSSKALRYYEKGLKVAPNDRQLLYNFAIALAGAGKLAEAVKQAEATVTAAPSYASANFLLAHLYEEGGARVPALLTLLGALYLEPGSPRSAAAARSAVGLLRQGVTAGDDGKNVEIQVSPQAKGGETQTADLFLSLAAATAHLPENKTKTDWENALEQVTSFLAVCRETDLEQARGCYACRRYLPLLFEIEKAELLKPFLHSALVGAEIPGAVEWAAAKAAERERYAAWRKARAAQ
jgi:tetratricopeptide (TPR) repeat protein